MAKRKVTVTVDGELLDALRDQGAENVSAAVNEALLEHAERVGRLAALRSELDRWDAEFGPVSAKAAREARQAFDELDGISAPDRGAA
jgi:post-segregation antitoxin (ccd killing protein)